MFTVKEAAQFRGIPIATIKAYCRHGKLLNAKLETSPIGEYWLIPLSDLESLEIKGRGRPKLKAKEEAS